jgi:hypothetical protein
VIRFLASLLLALFSFSLISPALLADADSNLPACCRRAGLHHCSLTSQRTASTGPSLHATRCPNFPGVRAVPAPGKLAGLARTSQAVFASLVSHPAAHAQTEARYRISYSRAGQKRGPPSLVS